MEQQKKSESRDFISVTKQDSRDNAATLSASVRSKPAPSPRSPAWSSVSPGLAQGLSPGLSLGLSQQFSKGPKPSTSGSKRSVSPPVAHLSTTGQGGSSSLLTGMLEAAVEGLLVNHSPNIPQRQETSISPQKKKPKTVSTRGGPEEKFLNDLVNRDCFTQFKFLDENQIKELINMFNIEFNENEDVHDVLREKVFSHVRSELHKRVKGDIDQYKRLLIQLSLPSEPKIACCVCLNIPGGTKVYNRAEIKKLSQDESEVVKFIHSNIHCDINHMCPNHYKSAFKKFVGLNKICSNPMNKENHKSKARLTVLKMELLADIKR